MVVGKRLFFLFFICFLSFQEVVNGKCSLDDGNKVDTCYKGYFDNLHITTTPSSYSSYYNFVKTYYLNSLEGVETFCTSFHTLEACVKNLMDCINKDDLANLKVTGDSGTAYAGNYYAFDYMCGDGKTSYKNAFPCFKTYTTNCNGFTQDCTNRQNENICLTNEASRKCGSEAKNYVNKSMSIVLCNEKPECCNAGMKDANWIYSLIFGFPIIVFMSKFVN